MTLVKYRGFTLEHHIVRQSTGGNVSWSIWSVYTPNNEFVDRRLSREAAYRLVNNMLSEEQHGWFV